MNILLVDDNADYLVPMKDALYAHGYNVVTAGDGRQACQIISSTKFDLIVSDIKMPHVDGIGLRKFAREIKQYAQTKFVFISGCPDAYAGRLELTPDRDYFLDKTMSAKEIVRFIDKLVFGKYAEVWV